MLSKLEKLADIIVNYSCSIKAGEKVLINSTDVDDEFVKILIQQIYKVKAYPFLNNRKTEIEKEILKGYTEEYGRSEAKYAETRMKDLDTIINVRGSYNIFEVSDIPNHLLKMRNVLFNQPIYRELGLQKKWVLLNYPTRAYAQQAGMSFEKFKNFYFDVCTLDYSKMNKAMDPLKDLMKKTNKVRILGKGTDLEFSIKGMNVIKCSAENNIPDGEIYTAPIKNSVNGVITYTIPTINRGIKFEGVKLEIKDGKIIKATAKNNTKELNEILDTDEGSRYFGEFSLGVNPHITEPVLDILFDEKMCGSIHFTPGNSYEEASNGNKSAVHWDMVLSQMPEYGGGEIYFDDVLIRKDGKFVLKELFGLNPENLK